VEPLAFDSSDLSLIEKTVSGLYSRLRIRGVGERTRARITRRVMTPSVGFDDLDYSFDISYCGEPQGQIIICDIVSSTIRWTSEGHDETFGPGDLFLVGRPDLPYAGVAYSARLQLTVLNPAICTRTAASLAGGIVGPVRLLDHRPVSRSAALQLHRTIGYLRDSVLAVPEAQRSPLVVGAATELLAASVLMAFPNSSTATGATAGDRHDASPATLRRAIAFIEASPDADIGITHIARAAYVTPRAIQLAFRRHLNTTPTAYLRRVRLDQAHQDLARARPGDGITVTAVSYRWGFSSPSRFAAEYRDAYGALPSDTLSR